MSERLPSYGGATYNRWGRTSCSTRSSLIYKGMMAGAHYDSHGGGSNFLCLPEDPQYSTTNVGYDLEASIYPVQYETSTTGNKLFGNNVFQQKVPCAACETNQRITKIMIPAYVECPSSEWTLEYQGYLMSERDHVAKSKPRNFFDDRGRGSYICVDSNAEPGSQGMNEWVGGAIYPVNAHCTSDGGAQALQCPPYKTDGSVLSCVVCSK